MEDSQTWRDLLSKIIIDGSEKQRIADALGVNPSTLVRWTTNKSQNPREDNLRQLIGVLTERRQEMTELIQREYPSIFLTHPMTTLSEISSDFYARIMNAHITSPSVTRSSAITTLVLKEILTH